MVIVNDVIKNSPSFKAKIKAGDGLVSINGNEIMDVLDYRFYILDDKLKLTFERNGKIKNIKINKGVVKTYAKTPTISENISTSQKFNKVCTKRNDLCRK